MQFRQSPFSNTALVAMALSALSLAHLTGCGANPSMLGLSRTAAEAEALKHKAKPSVGTGNADTYYRKVAGLTGKAMMNGLHALTNPHKVLTYDPARDVMFGSIDDVTNTDTIRDVYCGRTSPGITDRKSAFHRGLNAEHTWPQSMGASEEPMRSDLHHLFPADAGTNSQRGNHPFGDCQTVTEVLPNYVGDNLHSQVGKADGHDVFEPRPDHKGDVARALFYFYITYGVDAKPGGPVKIDNFRNEFRTLWKWHFTDPVSAKERARNEAIYKVQGNRNPFIDHPEYLTKIWLGRGGPAFSEGEIIGAPAFDLR